MKYNILKQMLQIYKYSVYRITPSSFMYFLKVYFYTYTQCIQWLMIFSVSKFS